MAGEMRRDVRRAAKRDASKQGEPPLTRDVIDQRVGGRRIQKDRDDDVKIFRFDDRKG